MDKKNILVIVGLIGFMLIWQTLILPSLPRELMVEEVPVGTGANLVHPVPSQGNLSQGPSVQSPPPTLVNPAVTPQATPTAPSAPTTPVEVLPPVPSLPEVLTTIETEVFTATFSSKGGVLTHLAIKDVHPQVDSEEALVLLKRPGLVRSSGNADMTFEKSQGENGPTLTYWNDSEKVIYRFEEDSHFFTVEHVPLKSGQALRLTLPAIEEDPSANKGGFTRGNDGAVWNLKGRSEGENSTATTYQEIEGKGSTGLMVDSKAGELIYSGFRNPYFGLFLEPTKENLNNHRLYFASQPEGVEMTLLASESSNSFYKIYAGPISRQLLYDVDAERYGTLFDYTGLNVIIHFLLWLLDVYNSIPGINMGVAIMLLTLTVKVVLFPMNLKAQTSMFMMSKIGPQIKELQEKYKNDRQQLGVKQMELFRENGVNPLAGCLPMLIQMPVFISLFSTIGEGYALRHAPFIGWIQDLSAPDAFMVLSFHIPFVGNVDGLTTNLNLLVLFYVVTMLIQQSMMPKSTEPQQQQMQKTMKFVMIGFAFILYNYSSGLMLYFVGSNSLGMLESWFIRNRVLPSIEAKKKAKA